jgi:hypothetical protein
MGSQENKDLARRFYDEVGAPIFAGSVHQESAS